MNKPALRRRRVVAGLAGLLALVVSCDSRACWQEVGAKYGVNPYLLYAIAKTESGLNPNAVHVNNADGSYDVGLMQINSAWFPTLARLGIGERQLLDPCINLDVAAWILAQNFRRLGETWQAIGAYNAASPDRQLRYARTVYRNLPK